MKIKDVVVESVESQIQEGDSFDLELGDLVIETGVVGFTNDGVILEADSKTMALLGLSGALLENVNVSEVSMGDYYKKATMGKAMAQMSAGFARSPEDREKNLGIAARREKGLARAKARGDKRAAAMAAARAAEQEQKLRDKYAGVDIDAEIARLKPAIERAYHDYQYGARNTYSSARDEYQSLQAKVQELERAKAVVRQELDEISDRLRNDYVQQASTSFGHASFGARSAKSHPGLEKYGQEQERIAQKRAAGLRRALSDKRLGKEQGVAEAGMTTAELQMEIRELQRQANAEMVAQNSKSSVGRNYQRADMMYARIRELESQLRRKQGVAEGPEATYEIRLRKDGGDKLVAKNVPKSQVRAKLQALSKKYGIATDEFEYFKTGELSEQGVAEGVNDTVYPNAEVIKSKNGKPVGEIYQDGAGWGCFHYKADYGADSIDSREEALEWLKDIAEEYRQDRSLREQGVAEGAGSIGLEVKKLCNKFYRLGDDAVDHVYHNAPLFAQFWDQYEGDINSLVQELSPKTLQRIYNELLPLAHEEGIAEARAATASFRAGNKKRAELNAMSDEERRAYDKEQQEKQRKKDDARLEKERQKLAAKKKRVAEGSLNEFAPGGGGRWYNDSDIAAIVGRGWLTDMDVSGDVSKEFMLQQAQDWLESQGYQVQVSNCKLNDDDMDWYIEGALQRGVAEAEMDEAKYQGREVPLGKPMQGDVKKSKVYVRGPKGNVVKVNFGDKKMKIKKSNPKRRKSFRARHNCANPGPRWKARYWSCRAW